MLDPFSGSQGVGGEGAQVGHLLTWFFRGKQHPRIA